MNRQIPLIALGIMLSACTGASPTADAFTFVLYRNSMVDENMRIHVATFDASDGEAYNRGNCDQAKELFQAQPVVKTKFWCEKGPCRK